MIPPRNVVVLFFGQVIFLTGTVTLVTLGGIVGSQIAPDPALATLPLSLMVVGTAAGTVPAALLMQRIGRRAAFLGAAGLGFSGAVIAGAGLGAASFAAFTAGAALVGVTLAFSAQFRFAAAESVPPDRVGWAVSIILVGSIGGAILGPEIVARSPGFNPEQPYQGAMYALAAVYVVGAAVLLGFRNVAADRAEGEALPPRPLPSVVAQPRFLVAMAAAVVGQGAMVFVMTATPLSMHVVDGYSIEDTARVVQAHVVAMYLPSLVSAPLLARLGTTRLMAVGALTMGATVAIGLAGREIMHYWWGMVLLGVGWNFLFIGGTTQLVSTYRASERFRAQAVNDFGVFGMSAVASLLAGTLLHSFGWHTVLWTIAPALAAMLLLALIGHRSGMRPAVSAE